MSSIQAGLRIDDSLVLFGTCSFSRMNGEVFRLFYSNIGERKMAYLEQMELRSFEII